MADLSIILDPGGIEGVRPGINVQLFPCDIGRQSPLSDLDLGTDAERLGNDNLTTGGTSFLYEIEWDCILNETDYYKVKGLTEYTKNARVQGRPWEVIIYNLVEPHVEEQAVRTRFKVPGTDVISSEDIMNGNLFRYVYWVALQGALSMTARRQGHCYECKFFFKEGTKLLASQET